MKYYYLIARNNKTDKGYADMRCLESDMTNANFEFMALHGLTNTNKY